MVGAIMGHRTARQKITFAYCEDYRIAVAQTAPPARNVTPAMKIAVSNLVISQPLRIARLNCLTARMASEYLTNR